MTLVSEDSTFKSTGRSNAEPTVSDTGDRSYRESRVLYLDLVRPHFRYGKRKRPSRSVEEHSLRLVSVWRAVTCAFSTTAPVWSVTRPLMLA